MKIIIRTALPCLLLIAMPGCLIEMLSSTAIQSGLAAESAKTGQRAMNKAQASSDEQMLRSAVQAHFAEYGTFPPTLDALVPQFVSEMPIPPAGFAWAYDANSGAVSIGTPNAQPRAQNIAPPSQEDYTNMQTLYSAIDAYGQNTGYYPGTLADLAPAYIMEVPKTTSGKQFKYDPATGELYHPYDIQQAKQAARAQQAQQQAGGRGRGAVAGGGPLGETLTGINMQQQMNAQSQDGVTRAGSAGRENVRGVGAQQTQRHEQAIRDLGL